MTQADRPNLLILYPDQWRADALGCAGNPVVQTPHLDRLARDGLRFTHAFVANPVCTASRASFMTGRYPHATGVTRNQVPFPDDEVCFAESLAAAGYHTGYIGKWHLDGDDRPGFVPTERRHGWQYWAAFNRGHRYHDGVYFRDDPDELLHSPGFESDHQTDLAIDFLEAATGTDQPFCLLLSWGPPHTPLEPPERHRETYDPATIPLPASVPADVAEAARRELAPYYGLVSALDDNVGRLMATLDRLEVAENTIVLFTSDHGDLFGEHGLFRKTVPYDEATRVPCIVRWPGHVPTDATTDALFHSVDVAPTLLALCGVSSAAQVQGYDLSSTVLNGGPGPRESVYLQGRVLRDNEWWWTAKPVHVLADQWRAIRTHEHLLAADTRGEPFLLFDLDADPLAVVNLVDQPLAHESQDALLTTLRTEARSLGDDAFLANVTAPADGTSPPEKGGGRTVRE